MRCCVRFPHPKRRVQHLSRFFTFVNDGDDDEHLYLGRLIFTFVTFFFIFVDDGDDDNHLHLGQPPALVLQQCKDLAPESESG